MQNIEMSKRLTYASQPLFYRPNSTRMTWIGRIYTDLIRF
jgi:hypothetical protein